MARRSKHTIRVGDGVTVRRITRRGERPGEVFYWRSERYLGQGKRETVWTGWGTREEAQQHVAALLASGAIEGTDQRSSNGYTARDVVSVRDLIDIWYGTTQENNATLAPRTIASRGEISRRLVKHFGHVHPSRVNEVVLAEYRDSRLRAGAARGSVFNEIRLLRQAWEWSKRQGLAAADLYLPRKFIDPTPTRIKRTPTQEDMWAVVDWIQENARARHHADLFVLLGTTGMRVGGAARLQVKDYDGHHAELTIHHKGETRTIPLPEAAVEVLERRCAGLGKDRRIFGEVKQANLPRQAERMLGRACEALELLHLTPHGFRRMVIEVMLDKGIDVATVASYVGNSPATIYKHYRQVRPEQKRRAVALAGLGKRPEQGTADVVALRRGAAAAVGE